jgi:hypothetical protein
MIPAIILSPSSTLAQIYQPDNVASFSPTATRLLLPWMIIITAIRVRLVFNFTEKGYYDATMITLAVALWYWNTEYWWHATVLTSQYVTAMGLDVIGLMWLWLARAAVVGGGK